ncbi:MAG: Mur ligase family protein [Pyrinomonadaceae bacterium]
MKIERIRNLSGPNVYTPHPALIAWLDFADLTDKKSTDLPQFNEKLLALVPSLEEHFCNFGLAGGVVKCWTEGAFLNHVIEHLIIEFSHLADCGIGVNHIKLRESEKQSRCNTVVVKYKSAQAMQFLLETAIEFVIKITADEPLKQIQMFMKRSLAETRRIVLKQGLENGFNDIVKAATERNIPVQLKGENSLQLGYGRNSRMITAEASRLTLTNAHGNLDKIDNSALIEELYPNDAASRIPLISVTGTNGKTTVTRIIAHVFEKAGSCVGMTTTDGIWIDGECIKKGDTTGPQSARVVLSSPLVEVAVLETARGGIVRRGLGYDWSDVAVITNIQPDHFGQDGIENINDILRIKSLIAERVRAGGTLVLNADDELLARLANEPRISSVRKNIVYFSLKPNHITLKRHTLSGGTAYTARNGWLVEASRMGETPIIKIEEIPIALGGFAEFNLANVLAAVAACRAQNLTIEQIASSLRSFQAEQHNHGRADLYEVDGAYVFLDYGHNPEAFKSICKMTAKWDNGGRRVIGIIAVPGDRANSLVMQAGRIAARGFHRVVIREDADLRGRATGEVAQILLYSVRDEVPDCDCQIILDESEALRREIARLQPGDILVSFYENYELVRSILDLCDAQPVSRIDEFPNRSFFNFRQA